MSDDMKKKKKKVATEDVAPKKKKKKVVAEEETTTKKKKKKGLVSSKGLDLKPKKKVMKDLGRDVSGTLAGDDKPKKKKKEVAAPEITRVQLPVEQDDYIIVQIGKKNKLVFAHSPKRNTGYLEESLNTDEPVAIEYDGNTLIANLGKDPKPGKVFGVEIMPHLGEIDTPIGPMHFYRKVTDAEKEALRIGIKKAHKKIADIDLEKVFPISRIEVHNPKGKWAGTYSVNFKSGEAVDLIKLFPKILEDQIYNQYVMIHEIGHGIWYRFVPEKIRALWLEQYNTMTKVSKAKKADMESLCQSLVNSQMSIREFQRDLEEDELALFKEALSYLKKVHKMSPEDANVLLNQNSKVLAEIWPTTASFSNTDSVTALLGEYAGTSVQEMFAESFALHLTGKQIPKTILKLLEKTLKVAIAE